MRRTVKRWISTCLLIGWMLGVYAPSAHAWQDLDIKGWLSEPGVKLLAVEFYATWCKPCQEAIPRWGKLQEKYRSSGLRVVVVSVQSEGSCSAPDWTPDGVVCDYDGDIAQRWNATDLPQAFLWSWQGNLLVAHGEVDQVERAVEKYFRTTPRILVEEPTNPAGRPLEKNFAAELKGLVRSEFKRAAKFDLVADEKEIREIRKLRKKGYEGGYSEHTQCRIGEDLSPNSQLKIIHSKSRKRERLRLELFSLEKGCLTASSRAPIIKGDVDQAVIEAVAKLVKSVSGTIKMPTKPPKKKKKQSHKKRGILAVNSEPPGAKILISGEAHGRAPIVKEIWAGDYELEAHLEGYEPSKQTVKVEGDLRTEVTIYIVAHGTLDISTNPPGATIKINGETVGKSPLKRSMGPGDYKVEAILEGHETASRTIKLESAKTAKESITLKPIMTGTLKIVSEPTGAIIMISGEEVGSAPVEKKLAAGAYLVEAEYEGYKDQRREVNVEPMKTTEINLKLAKSYPMNPYKLWGHVAMWTGVGFLALGSVSAYLAKDAADRHKSGSASAYDEEATYSGLMYTGFALGAGLVATGITLWILSPGDKEWYEMQQKDANVTAGFAPTIDGKGGFIAVGGQW